MRTKSILLLLTWFAFSCGSSGGPSIGPVGSGGAGGVPDSGGAPSGDATTPDVDTVEGGAVGLGCLAAGQETLLIEIQGDAPLSVASPSDLGCLSGYVPATLTDDALLNLTWTTADGFVSVRLQNVMSMQTGSFTPFSVLMSVGSESWLGQPDRCRVTILKSEKIVEAPVAASREDHYRVDGSMSCDNGWALDKPNDVLVRFEFVTLVTLIQIP